MTFKFVIASQCKNVGVTNISGLLNCEFSANQMCMWSQSLEKIRFLHTRAYCNGSSLNFVSFLFVLRNRPPLTPRELATRDIYCIQYHKGLSVQISDSINGYCEVSGTVCYKQERKISWSNNSKTNIPRIYSSQGLE